MSLAPEVVNYEPLTCATDMWNVGILIYVLVTGHTPFGGTTKLDTQSNITHCVLDFPNDLFEKISKNCIDLIKNLIVRIPKYEHFYFIDIFILFKNRHRITANDSLKHPWLTFNEETKLTNSLHEDDKPLK